VENADPTPDPYSDVSFPTSASSCISGNLGSNNVNTTVSPGHYCALSLSGHITFQPGLYIVDGSISSNGQDLTGTGVTFALGGNVSLTGSVGINLSAPTSGTYSGLLFFGDRDATMEDHKITGNTGSTLQGAIYFPTGNLEYTGSSANTNGCTQVIANTILFSGNSTVRSSCQLAGTRDLTIGNTVSLAE